MAAECRKIVGSELRGGEGGEQGGGCHGGPLSSHLAEVFRDKVQLCLVGLLHA